MLFQKLRKYFYPVNWLDNKIVYYITPQIFWEIGHGKANYTKLVSWWAKSLTKDIYILVIFQAKWQHRITKEKFPTLETKFV